MDMNTEDFAEKAAEIGSKVQYTGATGSIIAGLALSEIGVIIGIIVGICGFFVTWYYKHKAFTLYKKRHDIEIESLTNGKKHD
jgi:ABC-type microcin C transport system permease subunit YejE